MKGVPIRLEIGPRDIENNQCVLVRRDTLEKEIVSLDNVNARIAELLEEIQKNMFNMAKENTENKTTIAKNLEEFENNINTNQGYVKTMWCGSAECEEKIHNLTGAKSRVCHLTKNIFLILAYVVVNQQLKWLFGEDNINMR